MHPADLDRALAQEPHRDQGRSTPAPLPHIARQLTIAASAPANRRATSYPFHCHGACNTTLAVEWSHHATNTQTCERQPDGTITCFDDGSSPTGFEWCMNAPVVDREGTVYGTNEDGNVYAIGQGGVETGRFFLDRTRGAAYTPAAIDGHGRIFALNNGELFVVGQ